MKGIGKEAEAAGHARSSLPASRGRTPGETTPRFGVRPLRASFLKRKLTLPVHVPSMVYTLAPKYLDRDYFQAKVYTLSVVIHCGSDQTHASSASRFVGLRPQSMKPCLKWGDDSGLMILECDCVRLREYPYALKLLNRKPPEPPTF